MRKHQLGAAVLAVVLAAGLISGCGTSSEEGRADDLRTAAKSLIPARSTLIGEEMGACVEFADEPSCAVALFAVEELPPLTDRVQRGKAVAKANGWRLTDTTTGSGGTELGFEKDGFEAKIWFWRKTSDSCGSETLRDCGVHVDHVWVTYA
jgi:hypothetical protein